MTAALQSLPNRYIYSSMLICLLLMTAMLWMPATLGALAIGYGLDAGQLSRLSSFELLGFLCGIIWSSPKSLTALKPWLIAAVTVLVIVNLFLCLLPQTIPFVVLRPVAGLASGFGFGYCLKVCSQSAHPTRSFGILTGLMSVTMIIGFQSIAYLTTWLANGDSPDPASEGRQVVATIFALFALFPLLGLGVYLTNQPPVNNPANAAPQNSTSTIAEQKVSPLVWLGLFAILIAFVGQGSVWTFLQTLGITHGFSVTGVANAMSMFAIAGIVGSFSAAALPNSTLRWLTIGIALLVLFTGLYALYVPRNLSWYVFGCAAGGFYWNFALPQKLGLLAEIDTSGRGSVLGGSMSSAGAALGPLLAGLLISGSDYRPVGWMVAVFCAIGLVCVWWIEKRSHPGPTANNPVVPTVP
jgi:Major Facilitator Superfamily